jgi:hypothetical protein
MRKEAPKLSFGIISSLDFFHKLEAEYNDFDKNPISARHAINCALTSWHLTDWTFHEFFAHLSEFEDKEKIKYKGKDKLIIRISGLSIYQDKLIKKCKELKYMRLVANGSKHCILRDPQIKDKTVLYSGDFSFEDFNRHDFDVDRFQIVNGKRSAIDFEEVLVKTMNFWRTYIDELK